MSCIQKERDSNPRVSFRFFKLKALFYLKSNDPCLKYKLYTYNINNFSSFFKKKIKKRGDFSPLYLIEYIDSLTFFDSSKLFKLFFEVESILFDFFKIKIINKSTVLLNTIYKWSTEAWILTIEKLLCFTSILQVLFNFR